MIVEHQVQIQASDSQAVEIVQDNLAQLVQRAKVGDRSVLPAIRELMDRTPALWQESKSLADQVEQRWLQVLSGADLIAEEVVRHQIAVMKVQIAGPTPTQLEQLLVDRIIVCWLQVQQSELRAAERLGKNGRVLSNAEENRLEKVNRRFLAAVKSLAQVRKLLRPGAAVQINLANQQVNMA